MTSDKCPKCRHMWHVEPCLNMASDHECARACRSSLDMCEDCGWPLDSFACRVRHIQINTGDANSKRDRWDRAADLHNEHHF